MRVAKTPAYCAEAVMEKKFYYMDLSFRKCTITRYLIPSVTVNVLKLFSSLMLSQIIERRVL